jgi:hypothetical protein
MNQKSRQFCYIVLITSLFAFALPADFTLKGLTSWVKGSKEETYFKEIPFYSDGTLVLENDLGNVTIKSWSFPKIVIEAIKHAPSKELTSLDIETTQVANQLYINTHNASKNCSVDFQIIVPTTTNIILKGKDCIIKTKNIAGIQQVISNHSVDIQGASNSVQVTTSGAISVTLAALPAHATITLKSIKNSISLKLIPSCNASLKASTHYNAINSYQPITLKPVTLLLNKQQWENLKKTIEGNIGIGGPLIDLQAYNGITIY